MAGNLRDIREIETEIESVGLRGITKQQILDSLRSQAKCGGTMSIFDGVTPFIIAPGWNRVDVWKRSIDTQGVADGLNDATDPGGWYKITNAAAGDYTITCALRCHVTSAGAYEVRVAVVTDQDPAVILTTPYRDKVIAEENSVIHLAVAAGIVKDMGVNVEGVRKRLLQVEMRGPNGSTVTPLYGQFGVWR